MKTTLASLSLGVLILLGYSCSKLEPSAPDASSVMDAPVAGLTPAQNRLFNTGADEFDEVYTSEKGLGPTYVSTSCGSCHAGDSRGHLFTILTRFGQTDSTGNHFLAQGGPQLQNNSIPGYLKELLPSGASHSNFIAPIASGTGFLEYVSDADMLAMANANASNLDGVRGHVNWINLPSFVTPSPNAITQNGKYIGRFGRKASAHNLFQQTVQAYNQDMGLTTAFIKENPVNPLENLTAISSTNPEVSNNSVNANIFYLRTLQAPIQRNENDPVVMQGKQLFINIGCESCHKQSLKTGYSPIAPLSYQTFYPYTDLLLHDMGAALDDNYTEGMAKTSEWRTTPLWGLGLAAKAQGGNLFLMHDGRARSVEEAILLHGGESQTSKIKYTMLSNGEKEAVLKFLKSL